MGTLRRMLIIAVVLSASASSNGEAGETTRANLATDGTPAQFGNSNMAAINPTGRYVVFESSAFFLVPGENGQVQVYLRDRQTPSTERISVSSSGVVGNYGGFHGSVSADGRYVAFQSQSTNLVSPATPFSRFHVYLRDRQAGTTVLVSVTSGGDRGNGHSYSPSISADGRYIAFESAATNLTVPATNGQRHILRWDRLTGEIILVSKHDDGSQATASCYHPSISDDGSLVAFHTLARLESRDDTGNQDIYVRDIAGQNTALASVSSDGLHSGNLHSYEPVISGDGGKVAFHSDASNLIDDVWNGHTHIYIRDRQGAGGTYRASVNDAGVQGNGYSLHAAINGDGSIVAFESAATNLVAGDTNGWSDIFVHRRSPRATHRMSLPDDPLGIAEGDGWSWYPAISANGWFVAFESWSTNLVTGDTNGFADIFVRDIAAAAAGVASAPVWGELLMTVRPNPVSPGTDVLLRFDLRSATGGSVMVHDVTGRPVRSLTRGFLAAGAHALRWDGRDDRGGRVAPGAYFIRLESGRLRSTATVVLSP